MRKITGFVVVLVAVSGIAYAQQQKQTASLFLSDIEQTPDDRVHESWPSGFGVGAHYVAAPDADRRFRYQNHLEGEIEGGTRFMLTRQVGVLLDGRIFLGDHESYDDSFKAALGLNWRF